MSESNAAPTVKPPFGPPDCPWKKVSADSSVPETALYQNGKLNGDEVYIGRVYDGNCLYVGTAIPKKGICNYIDKNSEVKTTSEYEILTVDCGDPLWFLDMEFENKNIFNAGVKEDGEILYIGRYVDSNENTYYGWASKKTRSLYIPRDSKLGPQVLDEDFGVMIHRFLDRLCICPPCPF